MVYFEKPNTILNKKQLSDLKERPDFDEDDFGDSENENVEG